MGLVNNITKEILVQSFDMNYSLLVYPLLPIDTRML